MKDNYSDIVWPESESINFTHAIITAGIPRPKWWRHPIKWWRWQQPIIVYFDLSGEVGNSDFTINLGGNDV